MPSWKPLLPALACAALLSGAAPLTWTKLPTVPYKGKQDDVFFATPALGWYVNGGGKIYKTTDGGASWTEKLSRPGTFFRCVGFLDERHGFAGNIGPDYFPGVTDPKPLYETLDGGETWAPVAGLPDPAPKGLCAIEIQRVPFINAGQLDHRVTLWAGGRVGGPAQLMKSTDLGKTWTTVDLRGRTAMILDIKFFDGNTGILCGASDTEVEKSHAVILRTADGGKTWTQVYESKRPWELTWKASFPTKRAGWVTVQSYDPDPVNAKRVMAHTTDGGRTWTEVPLVEDHAARTFGVGFLDEKVGWVGGVPHGFQTTDGGKTWTPAELGAATNKFRFLPTPTGTVGYAIGVELRKLEAPSGK